MGALMGRIGCGGCVHLFKNFSLVSRKFIKLETTCQLYLAQTLWLAGKREEARRELVSSLVRAPDLLLPLLLASLDNREETKLDQVIPDPRLRSHLMKGIRFELERMKFVSVGRPALLLLSLRATEIALEDYRLAARADPGDPDLHRPMGKALFEARRSFEVSEAFEKVVSLEPKDGNSWRQLGSNYLRLMWWDSAIRALKTAMDLQGEQPATLLAVGYAFERRPDFDRAVTVYRKAARLAPSWAQAHYRLGRTLIKLDRLDEKPGPRSIAIAHPSDEKQT